MLECTTTETKGQPRALDVSNGPGSLQRKRHVGIFTDSLHESGSQQGGIVIEQKINEFLC